MAEKQKVTTPLGELMYVSVRGTGVLNYDGDDYEYKASIKLSKKDGKKFEKEILKFFADNAPSSIEKPANKIVRKTEDGDYLFTFKTKTTFDDKPVKVGIYNSKSEERELPDGVGIGNGSIGAIRGQLSVYTNGKGKSLKAGVSMFLNNIQLAKFVPYIPDSGFEEVDGDFEDFDAELPAPKKDKKEKKKKKKK
jgi:hypothetical protein